jgi:hypothetical protein
MPVPLLATKLFVPPPRAERVARPRLVERLNAGLDGLTIRHVEPTGTVLTGPVVHQAALYGLIAKLRDLSLPLSAVSCVEVDRKEVSG